MSGTHMNTSPSTRARTAATKTHSHRFSQVHGIYPLQRYVHGFGTSVVNAFDVDVWTRATCLDWLSLRLVVRRGHVRISLRQICADGSQQDLGQLEQDGVGTQIFPRLLLSDLSGALLPVVDAESEDASYDILFCTDDQPETSDLRINYVFCTFKRAEYVQHNTQVFRDYLRHHRAHAEAHLTLIDNGHDGSATGGAAGSGVSPDDHVTVFANNNTGGAGGFGRGIYETVYGGLAGQGFSHVCLLDDDIYLHPEMFARNTAFMRFLKPGYHVGAPMYPTSEAQKIPCHSACFGHQYCATVHPSDIALGAELNTSDIPAFLNMDRTPDSTGWWWSCFAVSDVLRIGLPYPFFIKMDDVEYSLRLQNAGVELVIPFSFWVLHDDFEEKYTAAMQYFRFRNRWVLLAQQDRLQDTQDFVHQFDQLVRGFVSGRKYEHAQLLLNAMDHFLRGPSYLITQEKQILSSVFALVRQEKNVPMPTPPAGAHVVNELPLSRNARNARLTERTWNNHFMPLKEHVVIDTTRPNSPSDCRRGQAVSYWNPHKGLGFTVQRDSARAFSQMRALRQMRQRILQEFPRLLPRYRSVKPHLTSPAFWASYGPHNTQPLLTADARTKAQNDQMRAQAHLAQSTRCEVSTLRTMAPPKDMPAAAIRRDGVTSTDLAILNSLRNRYQGQRCFVLGNGPSLTVADLDRLKDEITFAANKIYLCFDETDWRPTFYSVEDLLVAQNCRAEILALDGTTKIFADHMLPYLPRQANHTYARWLPPMDNRSPFREFSNDLTKGICWGSTITYSMLQMAVHMGFKEIFILGLDHSYVEPKTKQDGALVSEGEINHFHPDYRKPGEKWHYPVLDRLEHSYEYAKDFCDSIGVKVFNASRFSKLETFPRADLDEVLSQDIPS
ncbi:glycosyltransferase [Epibacterium sp. SM1979]|uniref:Glycosyltransferase n=2 Tax=Tritonibacter litoralis TaxID=2662264 RepID=A0A843YIV7_9RHOB|nr:glycosyltransferase [Tritonibacter litoralis]